MTLNIGRLQAFTAPIRDWGFVYGTYPFRRRYTTLPPVFYWLQVGPVEFRWFLRGSDPSRFPAQVPEDVAELVEEWSAESKRCDIQGDMIGSRVYDSCARDLDRRLRMRRGGCTTAALANLVAETRMYLAGDTTEDAVRAATDFAERAVRRADPEASP